MGLSQEVELQILLPREHLAMSGNIFGCHNWKWQCHGHLGVEPRGAASYSALLVCKLSGASRV